MELKPCPHCENELDTNSDSQSCLGKFYLSCMSAECGYTGPIRKTLDEAIAATNTRATDPLLKEMAEALEEATLLCDEFAEDPKRIEQGIKDALQKYREQVNK